RLRSVRANSPAQNSKTSDKAIWPAMTNRERSERPPGRPEATPRTAGSGSACAGAQTRRTPERKAAPTRAAPGEAKNRTLHRRVPNYTLPLLPQQAEEPPCEYSGKGPPRPPPRRRQQHALRQKLPHQSQPRSSESYAHAGLPRALHRSDQQQGGEIRARDQ